MAGMTHTTVDGVRYGIDADGNVLAPDADGTPDQLVIGRVAQTGREEWATEIGKGKITAHMTRREGIAYLAAQTCGVCGGSKRVGSRSAVTGATTWVACWRCSA